MLLVWELQGLESFGRDSERKPERAQEQLRQDAPGRNPT